MAYTPPALNAVNFTLTSFTPEDLTGAAVALTSYSMPALNAVDFVLSVYALPVFPSVDFELETAAPTYYGILKFWTGYLWTKALLKIYNGSWVSKPLKRWDSEWKVIDTTGI